MWSWYGFAIILPGIYLLFKSAAEPRFSISPFPPLSRESFFFVHWFLRLRSQHIYILYSYSWIQLLRVSTPRNDSRFCFQCYIFDKNNQTNVTCQIMKHFLKEIYFSFYTILKISIILMSVNIATLLKTSLQRYKVHIIIILI